tara:strand:+ start:51 stop:323 length:273 start_codon:yes stop_codon:yes gene_type:complete
MALGIGMMLGGSVYGTSFPFSSLIVDDYMWLGQFNGGTAGELEPIPTTNDFHDTWDIDGNDDYMLDTTTALGDEGYWIIDTNGDVEPLDV